MFQGWSIKQFPGWHGGAAFFINGFFSLPRTTRAGAGLLLSPDDSYKASVGRLADSASSSESARLWHKRTLLRRVRGRNRCLRLRQRRIVAFPSPGGQPGSVYSRCWRRRGCSVSHSQGSSPLCGASGVLDSAPCYLMFKRYGMSVTASLSILVTLSFLRRSSP